MTLLLEDPELDEAPAQETIRFGYLPWQRDVRRRLLKACDFTLWDQPQKTIVLGCGARSGKDRLSVYLTIEIAIRLAIAREAAGYDLTPRVNVWLVAPTYGVTAQWWEELLRYLPPSLIVSRNKQPPNRGFKLLGGIVISFKSADRPELLVSEGVDILCLTEAARMKDNSTWQESLLPRLASPGRFGLAIINSTPRMTDDHFMAVEWDRIKANSPQADDLTPEIIIGNDGLSWVYNLPSTCNPEMASKIGGLRAQMTEKFFSGEILAQRIPDADQVFAPKDIARFLTPASAPESGKVFVGVDPARTHDRTAIGAMRSGKQAVMQKVKALQGMELNSQISQLKSFLAETPGAELVLDVTGAGGKFFWDECRRLIPNVRIHAIDLQNANKEDLILALSQGFETDGLRIGRDVEEPHLSRIRTELTKYKAEVTPSGKVKYSGRSDDYVIMIALCWWRARMEIRDVDSFSLEDHWSQFF